MSPGTAPAKNNVSPSPNLVKNGDFATGKDAWTLRNVKDEAAVTWDESGGQGRARCFKAAATKTSQKLQQELESPLADDRLYELSADVKCDVDNMEVGLSTFCGYGITRGFTSGMSFETGKWTRLTMKATARRDKEGDQKTKVIIDWQNKTAGDNPGHIFIVNIQLKEIGRLDLSPESRNVDDLLTNGDFESGLEPRGNARLGGCGPGSCRESSAG